MLTLNEQDLHIWIASLNISPLEEQKYCTLLCSLEMQRANRFHLIKHKTRFIAAHGILRTILSLYCNIDAKELVFTESEYGKPCFSFPNKTELQFNMSHSGVMSVYIITKTKLVGIDIEEIKNNKNYIDIAHRFFSQEEYEKIISLPQQEQCHAFYQIWSRKEALLKAIGQGFSHPLSTFTVSFHKKELVVLDNKEWMVENFSAHTGYAAAYAVEKNDAQITFFPFTPNVKRIY